MSDRITDTIAEAASCHRIKYDNFRQSEDSWMCDGCGQYYRTRAEAEQHQAAAVLAALRANNIEPIQLPEPVHTDMGPEWPVQQHWNGQEGRPGSVYIRRTDGRISATSVGNPHDCPTDARSLAAALLAAVAAAEEGRS